VHQLPFSFIEVIGGRPQLKEAILDILDALVGSPFLV
jgi:hypothetical protein